jgi:hypothetical protein
MSESEELEKDVDAASCPMRCYAIGDRVIATRDIWQEADEHSPASMYAAKGDILIVRKIDMIYPVNVSHEGRPDNSFGVELDEIRFA